MKRLVPAAIAVLAILALAAPPAAAGQQQSGEKATGSVSYPNSGDISFLVFDIHEAVANREAKGNLLYFELDPLTSFVYYYALHVDCVNVDPASSTATLTGTVVYTNVPEWDGKTLQAWFFDGGTPGSLGDRVAGNFYDAPDCGNLDPTAAVPPSPWIDVAGGNLTVHASN